MKSGIIFLAAINVMILSQIFVQAYNRNKALKEIKEKLNTILEKLK